MRARHSSSGALRALRAAAGFAAVLAVSSPSFAEDLPPADSPAAHLVPDPAFFWETFYVEHDGQAVGPLRVDQVREQMLNGTVTADTLVWKSGTPDWVRAADVPELNMPIP
jgi:hypothetical protein